MKWITTLVRKLTRWAWSTEAGAVDGMAKLVEMHAKEGEMELHIKSNPELALLVATSMASIVDRAPNYCEMQFHPSCKFNGEWQWLTVTIQKLNGKTPHQLKVEAEEKVAALERKVSELESKTIEANPS